jgi:hypothetical protein
MDQRPSRRSRPKRRPYLVPKQDDTIDQVAARQEEIFADMIQAVYSLQTANDKMGAEGREHFLLGGPRSIPPGDVEATCRFLLRQILY